MRLYQELKRKIEFTVMVSIFFFTLTYLFLGYNKTGADKPSLNLAIVIIFYIMLYVVINLDRDLKKYKNVLILLNLIMILNLVLVAIISLVYVYADVIDNMSLLIRVYIMLIIKAVLIIFLPIIPLMISITFIFPKQIEKLLKKF